jgi:hypothetical protein
LSIDVGNGTDSGKMNLTADGTVTKTTPAGS